MFCVTTKSTKFRRTAEYLRTDIWRVRSADLSRGRSLLIRRLRIIVLAVRGFHADKCGLRASALTFYSVLSIVPVAAVAFGIAQGFGLEKILEGHIQKALAGHEEVATRVITFSRSLLENTGGGVVAGIGVLMLLWSIIKVLGNIEESFNDIWGVKKSRGLGRKFTDYGSLVLICPILLVISGAATSLVTAKATMGALDGPLAFLGPVFFVLLGLLPLCISWALFAFVYVFLPNTKVRFTSGLVAGIIAGTLYVIIQWLYVGFQVGLTKYNAIYGSFAALPFFLIWLQTSWLVVLFGAELSFAHQNVETYEFEPDCLLASHSFKRLFALRITSLLARNFAEGAKPMTAAEVARVLEVPARLTNDVLSELVAAEILSETSGEGYKGVGYQPARDIATLTAQYVIDVLDRRGTDSVPIAQTEELRKLSMCLKGFGEAMEKSPANVLLKDV